MGRKRSKKRVRRPNLPVEALKAARANGETVEDRKQGFNPDYSYVIKDLKRIGLLAGFFIVLLIVLSIYLR